MTPAAGGLGGVLRSAATAVDPEPLLCGWCTLGSAFAAEMVGRSGADLVCVDVEHGLLGWDQALAIVVALSAARIPVVVRVPSHEPVAIMKALDAGADGVIVPHVGSAAEAAAVAAACRYPPDGSRSWGPTRASLLGAGDTIAANAAVACIAMVESAAAAERAEEIAATEGIDAVLVGGNDLALDMLERGGSVEAVMKSAEFERRLTSVAASCREVGIIAGAPCLPSLDAGRLRDFGFGLVVAPSDAALLRSRVECEFRNLRASGADQRDLPVPTPRY